MRSICFGYWIFLYETFLIFSQKNATDITVPGVIDVVYDNPKPLKRPSPFVVNRNLILLLFDTNRGGIDKQKLWNKKGIYFILMKITASFS